MSESPPSERRLISLHVSPWSERAKWALDHHRLSYQKIEHAPMLGERRLRKLVGNKQPRATVPILLVGDQVLPDSWAIAEYADQHGQQSKLILPGRESEIRMWNELANETMAAGRALVAAAMLRDPAAVDEGLPRGIPRVLMPLVRPVGRFGLHWFARKYGLRFEDEAQHLAKMRSTLTTLRGALAKSSPYLLGTFSYADIVMATLLQGISPVDDRFIKLRPATRKAWTRTELASEFADLLKWRDLIYEKHRR